jgi:hypothetical protein
MTTVVVIDLRDYVRTPIGFLPTLDQVALQAALQRYVAAGDTLIAFYSTDPETKTADEAPAYCHSHALGLRSSAVITVAEIDRFVIAQQIAPITRHLGRAGVPLILCEQSVIDKKLSCWSHSKTLADGRVELKHIEPSRLKALDLDNLKVISSDAVLAEQCTAWFKQVDSQVKVNLARMGEIWPEHLATYQAHKDANEIFEVITDFDGTLFFESWAAYRNQQLLQLMDTLAKALFVAIGGASSAKAQAFREGYQALAGYQSAMRSYQYLSEALSSEPVTGILTSVQIERFQTAIFVGQDLSFFNRWLDDYFNHIRGMVSEWLQLKYPADRLRAEMSRFFGPAGEAYSKYGAKEVRQKRACLQQMITHLLELSTEDLPVGYRKRLPDGALSEPILVREEIERVNKRLAATKHQLFFERYVNAETYHLYESLRKAGQPKLLVSSARSPVRQDDVASAISTSSVSEYGSFSVMSGSQSHWGQAFSRLLYLSAAKNVCHVSEILGQAQAYPHRLLKLVYFTAMYILRSRPTEEAPVKYIELFDDQFFETHPSMVAECNRLLKQYGVNLAFHVNVVCQGGELLTAGMLVRREHAKDERAKVLPTLCCEACCPSAMVKKIVSAFRTEHGDDPRNYRPERLIRVIEKVYTGMNQRARDEVSARQARAAAVSRRPAKVQLGWRRPDGAKPKSEFSGVAANMTEALERVALARRQRAGARKEMEEVKAVTEEVVAAKAPQDSGPVVKASLFAAKQAATDCDDELELYKLDPDLAELDFPFALTDEERAELDREMAEKEARRVAGMR